MGLKEKISNIINQKRKLKTSSENVSGQPSGVYIRKISRSILKHNFQTNRINGLWRKHQTKKYGKELLSKIHLNNRPSKYRCHFNYRKHS